MAQGQNSKFQNPGSKFQAYTNVYNAQGEKHYA